MMKNRLKHILTTRHHRVVGSSTQWGLDKLPRILPQTHQSCLQNDNARPEIAHIRRLLREEERASPVSPAPGLGRCFPPIVPACIPSQCHATPNGVSSVGGRTPSRIPAGQPRPDIGHSYPAQDYETAVPQGTWREV